MNARQHDRESEQILSALSGVLRRRKPLLVLCLLGALGPLIYYNQTATPVYEANASVVFEELRGPVPEDVRFDVSKELTLFNRIEEINSRAFAENLAATLPPWALTRFGVPPNSPPGFDRIRHVSRLLDEGIAAFPVRNSNIVRIRVRLADPQLCALVADSSLNVLEERVNRVRDKGVAELLAFIEQQFARSGEQLKESEQKLMDFKQRSDVTSLDSDSREMLRKLTDAEVLYNAGRAERASVQERLTAVTKEITELRKALVSKAPAVTSASAQKLRGKLEELETRRVDLNVQKYPLDHPELLRLDEEIEQTRQALADEVTKLAKATEIGDPVVRIERLLDESSSLRNELVGLKAREATLNQTLESYRRWLSDLPAKEMELARLERELDVNRKTYMTLLEQRKDVRISQAKQIPGSRVIDRPLLPSKPIEPRKGLNLAMGAVLGLIVGFGVGFVLENRPGRMGSMLEFQHQTGWPVLGRVPVMRGGPVRWRWLRGGHGKNKKSSSRREQALIAVRDLESAAGESYSILRTQLEIIGVGAKYRSLLITSCGPREGKSSTLANLAAVLGSAGWSTVVVDAELRRPLVHTIFGVSRTPGLIDSLLEESRARSAGRPAGKAGASTSAHPRSVVSVQEPWLQESPVHGVSVLSSGGQAQGARGAVSWASMADVLENLKKKYEIVLVDSAPLLLVHDTVQLCGMVDAVVVVVDARSYDEQRLMEAKVLLERAGANVVGAVLNNVDPTSRYVYRYRRDTSRHAS